MEPTVEGFLRDAMNSLSRAVWLAEKEEKHATEGEILVVLAGLENIVGAVRKDSTRLERGIRRFGEMKHS